jgi:hypothetical protein
MSRAVLDLCRFDEIVFDYEKFELPDIKATRLQITVDRKTQLLTDLMTKARFEIVSGKKAGIEIISGSKADISIGSGSKSFMDIELIGGGK